LDDICLGKLSYGHGKAIASLSQDDITEIVKTIYEKKLSVRETERLVKDRLAGQNQSTGSLIFPTIQEESEDTVTLSFASKKEKEIFLKSLKNVR
jgi:ParB-like chromosome segregation protein Spo0J